MSRSNVSINLNELKWNWRVEIKAGKNFIMQH